MRSSLFAIIAFAVIATGIVLRVGVVAPPLTTVVAVPAPIVHAAEPLVLQGPTVIRDLAFPVLTAKSAAVVDAGTGVILGEKEKDLATPIASLTKLMTALVFLDTNPAWEKEITMGRSDNRPGGTLFVYPGERLTFYDLLMTTLVGSANNTAVALTRASGMAIPEFVDRMNEKAAFFGLTATHFVEPTGLDAGNVSTALDLVRLGWHAFQQPSLVEALTTKQHVFMTTNTKVRHHINTTDDLLLTPVNDYTIIGAKTGFTHEAGYTFLIEAEQKSHRVIVVVLGAATEQDRFRDADVLIRWAFEKYAW